MASGHMRAQPPAACAMTGCQPPPPGAILAIVMPGDAGAARAAAASDRRAVAPVTPWGNGCPP